MENVRSEVESEEHDTNNRSIIEIEDMTKTFNDGAVVAVDDLNLTIHEDEFIVFVGPSGCGKTTSLRCIAGLEIPDQGTITIQGQNFTEAEPKDRDLAFVFQDIALFPHLTVRENLRFGLDMSGDHSSERKEEMVQDVATMLEIDELLDRLPSELSGGQQQRVSIGRAMVIDPVAFLLDEPFSNLDANLRDSLRIEVKKLQRRVQKPMIFVTHDQEEALTLGDRIVLLNNGEVLQIDTPSQIYDNPQTQFVAEFIGSPSTNIIKCDLEQDGNVFRLKNSTFNIELTPGEKRSLESAVGDEVNMGVRPEHLQITKSSEALFDAEVQVIESLGRQDAVYLQNEQGQEIRIVTKKGEVSRERDSVGIDIRKDDIWIFDMDGERLF